MTDRNTDRTLRAARKRVAEGDDSDEAWTLMRQAEERAGLDPTPDPADDPVMDKLSGTSVFVTDPRWAHRYGRYPDHASYFGPGIDWALSYARDLRKGSDLRASVRRAARDLAKAREAFQAIQGRTPTGAVRIPSLSREGLPLPEIPDLLWIRVDNVYHDQDGDVLGESNRQVFIEEHGSLMGDAPWNGEEDSTECDCIQESTGGTVYVRLGCLCPGRQALAETLCALADYPILDEDDYSRREMESFEESWDSWMCSDVLQDLAGAMGVESCDVESKGSLLAACLSGPLERYVNIQTSASDPSYDIRSTRYDHATRTTIQVTPEEIREAFLSIEGASVVDSDEQEGD